MSDTPDVLVVRGTVDYPITYPTNGGEKRCVFEMSLVLEDLERPNIKQGMRIRVVSSAKLTKLCEDVVHQGKRVTVAGPAVTNAGMIKILCNYIKCDKLSLPA